jgi:hypothetical protein
MSHAEPRMHWLSPRAAGGSTAEGGEGGDCSAVLAPSTTLRVVPLPRFAGEEPKSPRVRVKINQPERTQT